MAFKFEQTGTVSVTNGSLNVTGTGTAWLTDYPAVALNINGLSYPVAQITGQNSLTLLKPYPGATASGLAYSFLPLQPENYSLARDVNYLLQNGGVSVGKSAYDLALENGFVGTEAEWLDSLAGDAADQVNERIAAATAEATATAQTAAAAALTASAVIGTYSASASVTVPTGVAVGGQYWTPTADSKNIVRWQNDGGPKPAPVLNPDGSQITLPASGVVADISNSIGINKWKDAYFRALHDAVPTLAFGNRLDGASRVTTTSEPLEWDLTASPFGNPAVACLGSWVDFYHYFSDGHILEGSRATIRVGLIVEAGTTVTISQFIRQGYSEPVLVTGPTSSVIGTGTYQEVVLQPMTNVSGGKAAMVRMTRTAGTGRNIVCALSLSAGIVAAQMTEDRASSYRAEKASAQASAALAGANDANAALTAMTALGKNLFNPNDPEYTASRFVSYQTGTLNVPSGEATRYSSTGFIRVTPGATYTRSASHQMAFYDANKVYVSGRNNLAVATNAETFVVPDGVAFARLSIPRESLSTFQFEAGPTATQFEHYTRKVKTTYLPDASAITKDQIANGAISPDKTTFFTIGKNLFNLSDPDFTFNKYVIYHSGYIDTPFPDANAYSLSGFISVTPGATYTRSASHQMAFYNANKVYVSGRAAAQNFLIPETFTVPADVVYARFSIPKPTLSTFQVESGSVATSYEPYRTTLASSYAPALNAANIPNNSITDSKVVDSSLSIEKMAFALKSKNLFNIAASDTSSGQFVRSDTGNLQNNPSYNTTGFAPIVPGQTYTRSYSHQMAYFSAAKTYVSGRGALPNAGNAETFTVPDGCYFARFTVGASVWSNFQVEAGSAATAWAPYGAKIDASVLPSDMGALGSRLDSALTIDGALIVNPYRVNLLRQTHYRLAKRSLPVPENTQIIFNLVGDSYTHNTSRWCGPFTDFMVAKFGDAGGGWCGFGFLQSGNTAPWYNTRFTGSISGTTLTVTALDAASSALAVGQRINATGVADGTIIASQVSGTPGGIGTYTVNNSQTVGSRNMAGANQPTFLQGNVRAATYPTRLVGDIAGTYYTAASPDLACATMSAGSSITQAVPALPVHNGCDLQFIGTPDGVIRYSWDNGASWTTVNTQGTADTLQVVSLDVGLPSGAGTLKIEHVTGVVKLAGVNLKSAAPGVRVNKLAATGSAIGSWANASATNWETGFAALQPNILIQMDGTNSQTSGMSPNVWGGHLQTLITRARAAVPGLDVLIATPAENQRTSNSVPMAAYAIEARKRALSVRFTFTDMQDAFGDPSNALEYGSTGAVPLYAADLIHPDPVTGGRVLLAEFLKCVLPFGGS